MDLVPLFLHSAAYGRQHCGDFSALLTSGAGPVYRLSVFAGEIRSGHLENQVALREGDVIHPLATEMNSMVRQYRQTIQLIDHEITEIAKQRERFQAGQDCETLLEEVAARAEEMNKILSRYKL